jgi:hypothetical protein
VSSMCSCSRPSSAGRRTAPSFAPNRNRRPAGAGARCAPARSDFCSPVTRSLASARSACLPRSAVAPSRDLLTLQPHRASSPPFAGRATQSPTTRLPPAGSAIRIPHSDPASRIPHPDAIFPLESTARGSLWTERDVYFER